MKTITAEEARKLIDGKLTEREFQAMVIQYAKLCGWKVYHTHDSRRSEPGLPDLILVRRGVLWFLELKKYGKEPTQAQYDWLYALNEVTVTHASWISPSKWKWFQEMFQ